VVFYDMAASAVAAPPTPAFFDGTSLLPPTVIFHLTARFKADSSPAKVNLGVGAYRDEALQPVVFSAVRKAEAAVVAAGGDKEYLPIAGLPELRAGAARLLFGADSAALAAGRVATAQTLSGTGSLTLGAQLLKRLLPAARMFCSDPTWENHGKVVADAGAGGPGGLEYYRYYDAASRALDAAGLMADLAAVPEGSVVLLHACAHNPTGVDPTREQWTALAALMQKRRLLPWFDIAYQGFASGDLDADAWAVRHFAAMGFEMLVSQSFAKNFGLYCERVGALHVVTGSKPAAAAVLSQLEAIARPMYSNPPAHGARVVARVLGDAELNAVRGGPRRQPSSPPPAWRL
jgi:aspartate aminotransferase